MCVKQQQLPLNIFSVSSFRAGNLDFRTHEKVIGRAGVGERAGAKEWLGAGERAGGTEWAGPGGRSRAAKVAGKTHFCLPGFWGQQNSIIQIRGERQSRRRMRIFAHVAREIRDV